jgi:predicted pyridoxine 5'-phosphate oxidase superfamily flavin-nucleotide-binding protein
MAGHYLHLMFGDDARRLQSKAGSRHSYARMEAADGAVDVLTARELGFLAARDSFYLATVTPDGWPYVQHRGGPPGFLKHLGGNRLGFAEYSGNRQYITAGNLAANPRASIICVDYAQRRRLKLVGHASVLTGDDEPALLAAFGEAPNDLVSAVVIDVLGFDWNCPQYITPRFTRAEVEAELGDLERENARLRAELARLQGAEND